MTNNQQTIIILHIVEKGGFPTADFFTTHPRSTQLREACLPIVEALDALVIVTAVVTTDDGSKFYRQIDRAREELVSLGIKPNVHLNEDSTAVRADPVSWAEFIGGQLVQLDRSRISSLPSIENATWIVGRNLGIPADRLL